VAPVSREAILAHEEWESVLASEVMHQLAREKARALLTPATTQAWELLLGDQGFPDDEVGTPSMFWRDFDSDHVMPANRRSYGYPGAIHVLYGARAAAKTWVAATWAAQEIRQEHHVVWYSFEPQKGLTERLKATGAQPKDAFYFHHKAARGTPSEEMVNQIAYQVEAGKVSLVVLDAMRGLQALIAPGSSSNDSDAIEQVAQQFLVPVARAGAAILLLDHRPKDVSNSSAIGGERKESLADCVMRLESIRPFSREVDGYSLLRVTKDRYGYNTDSADHLAYFTMESGKPAFSSRTLLPSASAFMAPEPAEPSYRKLILERLRAYPNHYTTQKQLASDLCEAEGGSLSKWSRNVKSMREEEVILATDGVLKAKVYPPSDMSVLCLSARCHLPMSPDLARVTFSDIESDNMQVRAMSP
jgi:hypothetical protein